MFRRVQAGIWSANSSQQSKMEKRKCFSDETKLMLGPH